MMEALFIDHPEECIVFFKRNMKFSLLTGSVLISVHIKALIIAYGQRQYKTNMYDHVLWFWGAARIVTYFAQLPVRLRLALKIWEAHRQNTRAMQVQHLVLMLRTWEWTVVQYISRVLLSWLALTIVSTYFFPKLFRDWIHRDCVLEYCLYNVILLSVQTVISALWLKRLRNQGWVDNTGITLEELRNSSDQFTSLEELRLRLTSRKSPFDVLPIAINPQTLNEDPMKDVQIYFQSHCGICKSSFSLSPSPPVESVPNSNVPVHDPTPRNDGMVNYLSVNSATLLNARVQLEPVILLPCGHIFHVECIESWITQNHSKCPFCNLSTLSERVWVRLKTRT